MATKKGRRDENTQICCVKNFGNFLLRKRRSKQVWDVIFFVHRYSRDRWQFKRPIKEKKHAVNSSFSSVNSSYFRLFVRSLTLKCIIMYCAWIQCQHLIAFIWVSSSFIVVVVVVGLHLRTLLIRFVVYLCNNIKMKET